MKAPKCRLCGEMHYGQCPSLAPTKGLRIASRPKPVAAATPAGDGVALTSTAHPKPPKGSPRPKTKLSEASLVTTEAPPSVVKLIKAKAKRKGKTKPAVAAPTAPGMPAKRPRGRPLQAEEKTSYENTKPWKKLKISRRTFYRRLKAGVTT